MGWIPHVMVVDDDARVLESLIPNLANELRKRFGRIPALAQTLGHADAAPLTVRLSAHGFESARLRNSPATTRPPALHLHMVHETHGRFEEARKLLNRYLFAVVVSDLRFSDDLGGQRAGKLFVEDVERVHPETVGLLYSAYPRPEGFPESRFVRKAADVAGEPTLADSIAQGLQSHLQQPAVAAFCQSVSESGLVYQSDSFSATLSRLYDAARLLGGASGASRPATRARQSLPCVLLDGESGTGKRGLATVFHAASERRKAPLVVASCNDLTNETLLRSILFGHKRGSFTDAREDRQGLVAAAGKGVLLLDDFHRLPTACSAVVHSFLEDGEYSRLGEEEQRRQAECAVVLTVESAPWRERRRSGELPLAFLARVERLPIEIAPLRERPDDIVAQSQSLVHALAADLGANLELTDQAIENLRVQPFSESNSRELRNTIEQAVYRHYRETELLDWPQIEPFLTDRKFDTNREPARAEPATHATHEAPRPALNEWQKRLRQLAAKIYAGSLATDRATAEAAIARLFDQNMPSAWAAIEAARTQSPDGPLIPMPVWEDLWRCFAVHWLGGPTPAEKVLGIPANTLRQWINDRESR